LGARAQERQKRLQALYGTGDRATRTSRESQDAAAAAKTANALVASLEQGLQPINHHLVVVADETAAAKAITTLAADKEPEWGGPKQIVAWEDPLLEALDLSNRLAALDIQLKVTRTDKGRSDTLAAAELKAYCAQAYIGITSADYCVADCATLVMQTQANHPRMVSLLPSIHIAVIRSNQIVADLQTLYQKLDAAQQDGQDSLTNSTTFISGPSKTADIELVMVTGAHGPREVHIIVIDEIEIPG
jgi:L-lactate dehydrogenase complex protein LldG